MKQTPSRLLNQIVFLYKRYSEEHRGNTQPFHLEKVKRLIKGYQYDCHDLLIREPLIEHSGSLPVIATTIYPYIDSPEVDLGKALTMLAVHDIGELVVGDKITFVKQSTNNKEEQKQALKLLPKCFRNLYLEMEGRKSETAMFAKSVDKITPDILDLMTSPEITIKRYKIQIKKEPREIIPIIREFKHPYMIWNNFMKNLHLEILKRIDQKLQPYY